LTEGVRAYPPEIRS